MVIFLCFGLTLTLTSASPVGPEFGRMLPPPEIGGGSVSSDVGGTDIMPIGAPISGAENPNMYGVDVSSSGSGDVGVSYPDTDVTVDNNSDLDQSLSVENVAGGGDVTSENLEGNGESKGDYDSASMTGPETLEELAPGSEDSSKSGSSKPGGSRVPIRRPGQGQGGWKIKNGGGGGRFKGNGGKGRQGNGNQPNKIAGNRVNGLGGNGQGGKRLGGGQQRAGGSGAGNGRARGNNQRGHGKNGAGGNKKNNRNRPGGNKLTTVGGMIDMVDSGMNNRGSGRQNNIGK